MDRSPLSSQAVVSAGYDSVNSTLELEFKSGRIYQYQNVPRGAYDWLLRTSSKGQYVSRMINGQYAFRDVTPSPGDVIDLASRLRASLEARKPPQE